MNILVDSIRRNERVVASQKVFKGAPPWVESFAVDEDGKGYWFAVSGSELNIEHGEWLAPMIGDFFGKCEKVGCSWTKFDASDWQNSVIDRDFDA